MRKQAMKTVEMARENIKKLASIFPNCVTEGRDEDGNLCSVVDFDLLRQELTIRKISGGGGRTIQT